MSYTRMPLESTPSSVAMARAATRRWAEQVGRPLDEYAAAIVVSELVSNAILHAHGPVVLHLWSIHDGIKIGVSDGSGEAPVAPGVDLAAPFGRGLRLVDALSSNWGYDIEEAGKTTWAEITRPERSAADAAALNVAGGLDS